MVGESVSSYVIYRSAPAHQFLAKCLTVCFRGEVEQIGDEYVGWSKEDRAVLEHHTVEEPLGAADEFASSVADFPAG